MDGLDRQVWCYDEKYLLHFIWEGYLVRIEKENVG
jgi:hypothetical protein